jgi:hypothetical protein
MDLKPIQSNESDTTTGFQYSENVKTCSMRFFFSYQSSKNHERQFLSMRSTCRTNASNISWPEP